MSLDLLRKFLGPKPARSCRQAIVLFAFAALGFAGCAQQPQQFAAGPKHGKEYFPASVYGAASRRVIEDGQPVPRGGGQYLVGRPYTVAGQTYYPSERKITQIGYASWYGDAFHGRLTANGEIYDRDAFSAAHPTMPLPSYARVTNLANHYSMIVRVNDRGPYASNRVMDVSRKVAEALDFKRFGTAKIKVEYVGRASLAGSDDAKLYATLRQGTPAQWQGEQPVMTAEAAAPARVASLGEFAPSAARPARYRENERTEALAPYRDAGVDELKGKRGRTEDAAGERRRPAFEARKQVSAVEPVPRRSAERFERAPAKDRTPPGRMAARLELAQLIDTSVKAQARGRTDGGRAARMTNAKSPASRVQHLSRSDAAPLPPRHPVHAAHPPRSRAG